MIFNFIKPFRANKKKQISLFFLLLCLNSSGLSSNNLNPSVDSILKAKNLEELEISLKKNKTKKFLKKLCEKQKKEQKIPIACYKLGEKADFWCLNLKLEDPRQLKEIEKALQSRFLSKKCKNDLKIRKKILKYREKDLFLPELKNYFTD